MNEKTLVAQKNCSRHIFNSIAQSYDFINRILSFGLDIYWRKIVARMLVPTNDRFLLLDCATGTGDIILAAAKQHGNRISCFGLDMANEMLLIAREKCKTVSALQNSTIICGDALKIPLQDNCIDAVTMAFGIRNMPDPVSVLKDMKRILKDKGNTIVLEFSIPHNRLLRTCHILYLRYIVPLVGGFISGNYSAYKYLNTTIEEFPYGENFCNLMRNAGYKNIKMLPLLGGVATVYSGQKT